MVAQKSHKGIVKFFNEEKGYGFLVENETGKDVFVHVSDLNNDILTKNDKVSFDIEVTTKGTKAVNVVII
jgi:CspA family cold shock protein